MDFLLIKQKVSIYIYIYRFCSVTIFVWLFEDSKRNSSWRRMFAWVIGVNFLKSSSPPSNSPLRQTLEYGASSREQIKVPTVRASHFRVCSSPFHVIRSELKRNREPTIGDAKLIAQLAKRQIIPFREERRPPLLDLFLLFFWPRMPYICSGSRGGPRMGGKGGA